MIYDIKVTAKELSEILNIKNANYISELVSEHNFPKNDYNKFPLVPFIQRWIEYQKELHHDEIKRIRERDAQNRLANVNAELKEIDLAIKRGTLIESRYLEDVLDNQAHIFIKGVELLRTKIPNLLNLSDDHKQVLNVELTNIREQIGTLPANISAAAVNFD